MSAYPRPDVKWILDNGDIVLLPDQQSQDGADHVEMFNLSEMLPPCAN